MTSQTAWSAAADFWPRADTSRFVRVGDIDFHVQVSGSGEEVLLLHGAGASAHSFSGLAARLSERHRVIAADLPGQGFTTLLPLEAVGLTPFARYLRDLMAALDAEPRWIIGHSAGAALAAEYALTANSPPK